MAASRDGKSDSSAKMQLLRYLQESLEMASKLTLCETPEDVAIFIGTTKSGKSTLLNSLLGNKLRGEKEPKLRSVTIVKADNSLGPEIGRGPTSETIYPTRWIASGKLRGLVLWDSPGFDDNRGPIQDIINAYYVYHLFRNINSAKIVLVTDVNDILNDRINPFLTLLTSVESIFKEKLNRCFSNIVVAFTKTPTSLDDEPVDVEFISSVLDHQILSSGSVAMPESSRNFVKHLIRNQRQMGLFKRAKVGPIPSNADAEVVQAVNSIRGVHREILNTVSPSIAHTSKLFLYEARHELTSNNSFVELEKSIKAAFEEKLDDYKRIAKREESPQMLSTKKEELIEFKNIVQTIIIDAANTSFHSKIEALQKIDPKFKNKIEADNLMDKSRMMEFIDGIVGVADSQIFNVNLRSLMETIKSDINEVIIDLQLKLHEIDNKEAKEMMKKSREEEKENRKKAEEERQNYEKQNKEVEERFFTKFGKKVGELIDDFYDYYFKGEILFSTWLKKKNDPA